MSFSSPNPPTDVYTSYRSDTSLRPYLQLPALLSLTWLAYPILSLVFVAFRLQLSLSASQDAVANAKGDLMTSCKAAEQAATAAASMPRYMAIASNEQFADAVNGSLNAARAALVLSLTVMEAIINFIIDFYRSTFLCFLELVVRGGLSILISAVQELNSLVTSAADSLRTSIQSDIASANSAIQTAIDGINKINPFSDITAPQIAVPSLDALQNVTLPTSFQDALTNLNNSLPTVADLKDKIESVIDTPFELLKKDINDTFSGLSFNSSVLPIPEQNRLAFCNDLDMSVVDDLGHDLIKIAKIGTIILIVLALLLLGLNCLLEWYKWRCMTRNLEYTRQAWSNDPTMYHPRNSAGGAPRITLSDHNLLMLHGTSAHPLLTRIANQITLRLRLSPSQHTHLQWFFHYIFHAPALACFLIGFFGLLSVQIQLLAMGPLVDKYAARSAATVTDFSNTIATSINASMYNQSAAYANDVNGRVDAIQLTINQGVFGWVNGTTTTLNTTIVTFYTDIQNAVSSVFNGTILEQPAQDFIKCLIGTKVDAIENALTFLHDNLVINMPRVNDTVLILSPESVNEATQPIAAAAIGGGADDDQGLVGRLVNTYAASLKKERLMFGIFMALWGFVVLMAICAILWNSYGRVLMEARKKRRWMSVQRSGIDGIVIPFRAGMRNDNEKETGSGVQRQGDLPLFTPMPSPKANSFKPFAFNWSTSSLPSDTKSEPSWDSFFGQKQDTSLRSKSISGPKKLMAIGRKAVVKESLVSDEPAASNDSVVELENRNTAWFGKMAIKLGKKQPEPHSPIPDSGNARFPRSRPNLSISIDQASTLRHDLPRIDTTVNDDAGDERVRSHWSASPQTAERISTTTTWKNFISPPKKANVPLPAMAPTRPLKTRHARDPSVPLDVQSDSFEESMTVPLKPTPLAPPIHHGFDSSQGDVPVDQAPLDPSKYRPPPKHPQQQLLAPPPDKHKRTVSIPVWKYTKPRRSSNLHNSITNVDDNSEEATNTFSISPVTRFLANAHARQSSNANPFVTPFDDEHRVRIDHPDPRIARKSIPTNPFAPIAL